MTVDGDLGYGADTDGRLCWTAAIGAFWVTDGSCNLV